MTMILLTGATSFLGFHIAKKLTDEGITVYALIRPDSENKSRVCESPHYHIIYKDIADIEGLCDIDGLEIDVCIHLAWSGVGRVGRMDRQVQARNIANTLKTIETVAKLGCKRFIFAGSQAEYGVTLEKISSGDVCLDGPIDEHLQCNPISEYGKAKLEVLYKGYELCQKCGMEYIHMRIFSVYGSGDHQTALIPVCINAIRGSTEIELSACRQMWNYLHVDDLARAVHLLSMGNYVGSDCISESIINICSDDNRILRDYIQEIVEVLGGAQLISYKNKPASEEGTPYLYADNARLREYTGFKPEIDFRSGLESYVL